MGATQWPPPQGGYGPVHPGGYDGGRPPAPQSSGMAVAALVLGIVAVALCWVPIINNVAAVIAVVAIVLGLVAARRAKKGRSGGLSRARAGWILGLVAFIGVLATQAFYSAVLDEVGDEIEQSVEEAEDELDGDSAVSEDDADQLSSAEEGDDVLTLGQTARVGEYDVTVTAVDGAADDAVAGANQFNQPPAGRYVLASLDVTYLGDEEGDPWLDLSTVLVGSDARNYDESTCAAVTPRAAMDVPTLTTGGQGAFDVCFDVPEAALAEPRLYVEKTFSFEGRRAYWSFD
ncbi:DUF4190 domain-containing protein [Nocardioides sp. CPCC 205120]|uniref:DUF4190 domain-containing protein n=1 Tax=Nocardioides sp. CPCC 205120 TaxID=3406462 RepID=UPI003B502B37